MKKCVMQVSLRKSEELFCLCLTFKHMINIPNMGN